MTEVINLRDKPEPPFIRIDRRTKWGNPHKITDNVDRAEAIRLYRLTLDDWISDGRVTLRDIGALRDKRLACWCAPLPCHGDVLATYAETLDRGDR